MVDQGQANLAALIEGRTDEEINQAVKIQGPDNILKEVFSGMAAAFVLEQAAGQSAVIQYNITAEDGVHGYQLKVLDGKCQIIKGVPEPTRVALEGCPFRTFCG
jgi:hypothetical protein